MTERRFGGAVGRLHHMVSALADRSAPRDAPLRRRLSGVYGSLLNALTLGRGVVSSLNGESFRVDPRLRWFLQPEYEADLARFLRERMRPGQCCLDIGAHIGVYALQMGRWVGTEGRIIAFEPNSGTAAMLRRHLRMNGLEATVRVEEMALGRVAGTAQLFGRPAEGTSRLGAPNPMVADAAAAAVSVGTVDAYCAARNLEPDWILIDVEGLEFDVIAGAAETIRRRGPALSIVVEIHPTLWPLTSWTRASVEALLLSIGRRPVAIVGQTDALNDYGSILLEPVPSS